MVKPLTLAEKAAIHVELLLADLRHWSWRTPIRLVEKPTLSARSNDDNGVDGDDPVLEVLGTEPLGGLKC